MTISLNTLIEALSGAVTEAQDRIEQHQMSHLSDFFDDDNRPKSVTMRLPSSHPTAGENDEDLYRAPLLALVSPNNLRIKDVEISFDADLGELTPGDGDAKDSVAPSPKGEDIRTTTPRWTRQPVAARPTVNVDTRAATAGKKGGSVHIVLRVEGTDPTDGAARLVNHLAQTQGVFKTLKVD